MAVTYKLNLYKFEALPKDNYALDVKRYYTLDDYTYPLTSYLNAYFDSDHKLVINNFQLQRIQLNNIFTVELSQDYAQDLETFPYNYATITDGSNEIPYKIERIIWNGTASCKLIATLDVATWFLLREYPISTGIIERCHIDRFEGSEIINGTKYLIPRIDFHEEPFETPIKYLSTSNSVRNIVQDTTRWNLVYYSDPNATNAIRTLIVPDTEVQGVTVRVNNSSHIEMQGDTYYIIRGVDNLGTTITYNGNSFTFGTSGYSYEEIHAYNNGGTLHLDVYGWNLTDDGNNWKDYDGVTIAAYTGSTDIYYNNDLKYYINPQLEKQQLNTVSNHYIIPFTPKSETTGYLNTTTTSVTLTGLSDIPLTNPRLIKIIACPFCPADLSSSNCLYRNISDDYMNINVVEWISNSDLPLTSLYSTSTGFISLITAPDSYYNKAKAIKYETKLLNSNYEEHNVEYGAYKLNIPLEMYSFNSTYPQVSYSLSYKQAKLKSDLLFKYSINNTLKTEFDGLLNAESNYLVSDIDNEKPIFTSEYLNYIKNGYNYDKTNMNRQTVVSSLLAGTSILGGVAGVAAGAFTGGVSAAAGIGLITSGVSSAINIINNRIASEASIQRKLASYKNSSTGVAGVNALDLRKEYNAYDLYLRTYNLSNQTETDIYNFFRFYGYQLNKYTANWNSPFYSRLYYNFVKAGDFQYDPQVLAEYSRYSDLLEEFKRILNEGLTIYHINGATDEFDFDRRYENFEMSLVEEE